MTGPAVVIVAGHTITSPQTALSNVAMAGACWWLAYGAWPSTFRARAWRWFLLLAGLALLLGAPKHGLSLYSASPWLAATKAASGLCAGLAMASAQLAALATLPWRAGAGRLVRGVLSLQLVGLAIAMPTAGSFRVVLAFIGPGLAAVMAAELWRWHRTRTEGWIAMGLLAGVAPAAAYLAGWPRWPWFTHIDLAHALMVVSLSAIARGARLDGTGENRA